MAPLRFAIAWMTLAAGCEMSHEPPPPPEPTLTWQHFETRSLDLLVMIDDSGSMTEEQASFTEQLPRLFRTLVTGDTDDDGIADFQPPESIHYGVVSSDMGTGGFRVPTCTEPDFGDDGLLQLAGNTAMAGCEATYPSFVNFGPGADVDAATTAASCVTRMALGGCGFEQQLEATLKAVTPSTSPIRFHGDTTGHADRENAGFLREDATLVVVLLTDEEDMSASDPSIYDPMSAEYTGDLSLRAFTYPEALHPVQRYVDGLLAAHPGRPDQLVYFALTGVPSGLVSTEGDNFTEILAAPEMQERVDTMSPTPRLVPSCNVPGRGIAFPPRRMVEVAQRIDEAGGTGLVQSICQSDFTPAINLFLSEIADRLRGPGRCVRGLPIDDCWIEVDGTLLPRLSEGEAGEGWRVDPPGDRCRDSTGYLAFTDHALPPRAEIALFCPTYVAEEAPPP